MLRLRTILLNTLTAISLVVAIFIAGIWVRSYWRPTLIDIDAAHDGAALVNGRLLLERMSRVAYTMRGNPSEHDIAEVHDGISAHIGRQGSTTLLAGSLGRYSESTSQLKGTEAGARFVVVSTASGIVLPVWPFFLVATIPFAIRIASAFLCARRGTGGRCLACGYDLRASPDRCPECGAMAKANL